MTPPNVPTPPSTPSAALFEALVSGVPAESRGTVMVAFTCEEGCRHLEATYMTPALAHGGRAVDGIDGLERLANLVATSDGHEQEPVRVFVAAALYDLEGNQVAAITAWDLVAGSLVPMSADRAFSDFAQEIDRSGSSFEEAAVFGPAWEVRAA